MRIEMRAWIRNYGSTLEDEREKVLLLDDNQLHSFFFLLQMMRTQIEIFHLVIVVRLVKICLVCVRVFSFFLSFFLVLMFKLYRQRQIIVGYRILLASGISPKKEKKNL